MFCAGGIAAKAGVAAAHTWFHAQNTTPNAIAIAAATTMSTVRQFVSRVISCTSLRCFEDEKRTLVERDTRGRLRDLVAEPAGLPETQRLAREREAEPFGAHALGVARHRQERDDGAHRTFERERSTATQRANAHRAAARLDTHTVVAGIGEEEQVRGLVVQARTAEGAQQDDLLRPGVDGVRDGELEIRLVLRRGELRHADALSRETLHARVAERIHVTDDEVGKDLPALERECAAVGRDHEVLRLDRSAIRRKNVAVRDDDRPHRWQNKSGA